MGDEYGINRLDNPFGKMGYLAAVEEQRSLQGADPQEEKRIIKQPSEECRFDIAEWKATSHQFSPGKAFQLRQPIKDDIQFDSGETGAVVAKPLLLRKPVGIKTTAPLRITEATTADV
jgi:hypothetical protein